jgi:hypothetical protein
MADKAFPVFVLKKKCKKYCEAEVRRSQAVKSGNREELNEPEAR